MSTQTTDTLSQQVIELVSRHMDIPKEQITLDSQFAADLGFDSLDVIEFVMLVEDTFDISISDQQSDAIASVRDAVRAIEKSISS
jgi:acyl carrier protein